MSIKYLAVPMQGGLLATDSPIAFEVDPDPRADIVLPIDQTDVRGVEVEVAFEGPCQEGWLELSNGDITSRRLVRDISGRVVFPLPDMSLSEDDRGFALISTHCQIRGRGAVGQVHRALSDDLGLVDTEGWVLYERLTAMPRVSLAERTLLVDSESDYSALNTERYRDVVFVEDAKAVGEFGSGTVILAEDHPDSLTIDVEATSEAFLVVRDAASSGWLAFIDGQPTEIVRTDSAFRGVIVPAGSHTVEFAYRPASFRFGLILALLGVLALIVLLFGIPNSSTESDD